MIRVALAALIASAVSGCGDTGVVRQPSIDVTQPVATNQQTAKPVHVPDWKAESIDFGGKKWIKGGGWQGLNLIVGAWFSSGDPDVRIGVGESAVARGRFVLATERRIGGRWELDGPARFQYEDGGTEAAEHKNGKSHGVQQVWWPNGKLQWYREYAMGKVNGREEYWYQNGQIAARSQMIFDEEVAAQSWNEDGTLLSKTVGGIEQLDKSP